MKGEIEPKLLTGLTSYLINTTLDDAKDVLNDKLINPVSSPPTLVDTFNDEKEQLDTDDIFAEFYEEEPKPKPKKKSKKTPKKKSSKAEKEPITELEE